MKDKLGTRGLLSDDNRSIAQFVENGMVYKGNNIFKTRILRYNVDGGMLNGSTKKCDKALGLPDKHTLYLIELKGCDLKEACEQILESIRVLGLKMEGYVIHGRVIW